jgi:hypothetical protein
MNLTRLTLRVGVDKDGAAALAEGFGKFRGELMASDNFNVLAGERLSQQAAGMPAKGVITSQRIAVTDDERSVHSFQPWACSQGRELTADR